MAHSNTVFHSLTKFISRHDLDKAERRSGTQNRSKTSRWSQFIALLMAQVLKLCNLRDIENASKSMAEKFYHLGAKPIPRSTLARMNETLDATVFKLLFEKSLDKCTAMASNSKAAKSLFFTKNFKLDLYKRVNLSDYLTPQGTEFIAAKGFARF